MVSKKGFSAADVAAGAMIFMTIVVVFQILYYYMVFHGRTELFTETSRLYEYSAYSSAEKMFLKDAAKYSFAQATQEVVGGDLSKLSDDANRNAVEERFKTIYTAYLSALTKKDVRITNSPKVESMSFSTEMKEVNVKLDKPIMLGYTESYVLVDNRIYCGNCM